MKKLIYKDEARNKIKEGIDAVADAVKITLGPQGRNVIMNNRPYPLHLTKDGHSIAKDLIFGDEFKDIGAQLIIEASGKSNDIAGDGTTTTSVLTQALINNCMVAVDNGYNPMAIKKELDIASKDIITLLRKNSRPINTDKDIKNIALISSNDDKEISEVISIAIKKIGKEGIINLEKASSSETSIEISDGYEFDKGYLSPYFITNTEKQTVEYLNPYILLAETKITNTERDILNSINMTIDNNRPLIIIAKEITEDVLSTIIRNVQQAQMPIAVVSAPFFAETGKNMMNDIAALVGGQVISKENGVTFDDDEEDYLGTADKVIIGENITTIIGYNGDQEEIKERIAQVKAFSEAKKTPKHDKKMAVNRLAKLTNSLATLFIGGYTETEKKEKMDRAEDAIRSTKAAIAEGILPGGGIALFNISNDLELSKYITEALQAPLKQIIENAGLEPDKIIKNLYKDNKSWFILKEAFRLRKKDKSLNTFLPQIGFDAREESYVDMEEAGIIDPTKVTISAIENSFSIAGAFITTECAIAKDVFIQ